MIGIGAPGQRLVAEPMSRGGQPLDKAVSMALHGGRDRTTFQSVSTPAVHKMFDCGTLRLTERCLAENQRYALTWPQHRWQMSRPAQAVKIGAGRVERGASGL